MKHDSPGVMWNIEWDVIWDMRCHVQHGVGGGMSFPTWGGISCSTWGNGVGFHVQHMGWDVISNMGWDVMRWDVVWEMGWDIMWHMG